MKKISFLLVSLFVVNTLFSQILYDEGIVKGKNVTYEVTRGKGHLKAVTFIRNVNNPDTTFCEVPHRNIIPSQLIDIELQVAEIMHDYLSPEELAKMGSSSAIGITFRMDAQKRKLLQITNFFYLCDEPFWANFSPDRLYDLERLILKKIKLPAKLQETYIEDDFMFMVFSGDIRNLEETREKRKEAIKYWKQNDIEVNVRPSPKFVIKDRQDEK